LAKADESIDVTLAGRLSSEIDPQSLKAWDSILCTPERRTTRSSPVEAKAM